MLFPLPEIVEVENVSDEMRFLASNASSGATDFDSIAIIYTPEAVTALKSESSALADLFPVSRHLEVLRSLALRDRAFGKEVQLSVIGAGAEAEVVVTSPTGPLTRDYDDVRRFGDAVSKALKRLRQGGFRRPLLVVQAPSSELIAEGEVDPLRDFSRFLEVSLLAAMAESFDSLETRETDPQHVQDHFIERLGVAVVGHGAERVREAVTFATAVEEGRRLARDVGGPDPERMAAPRAASYISDYFATSALPGVRCSVISDPEILEREYPLLMAVARASMSVSRHAPRVVELEYQSPEPSAVQEELYLIGKGITYDTGGADLKVNGNMVGMSRDKCGAAAVAGFIATAGRLQPRHVNIRARLAFVRNSIGPDSYVADEIIRSRAGVRVRVGNTDAEGRMVMADLLAQAKEEALAAAPERARLFTVATLTGHAARTYGPYVAALDNSAARVAGIASRLFRVSQATGDPFELSTLRREDFKIVAATDPSEDVLQANRHPSVATSRGHQYPMAFMITAAGLQKNKSSEGNGEGSGPAPKLAYTHLDIAGAAEEAGGVGLGRCTGAPIPTLTAAFLMKRFVKKLL